MTTNLTYALTETFNLGKWLIPLCLFIIYIFFCIETIIYIINNNELINSINGMISLGMLLYSITGLIVCTVLTLNVMGLERDCGNELH